MIRFLIINVFGEFSVVIGITLFQKIEEYQKNLKYGLVIFATDQDMDGIGCHLYYT